MFFFALPRIYLNEIARQINKRDKRTVKKWCNENFLKIHKDSSGEFAYQYDFDLVFDMPLINHLKLKHGDNWEDYYHAYNKNELYKMLDSSKLRNIGEKRYKPKGKLSFKLIDKLSK